MDSIHKYEKYQASIHGHTTGKEINHLDEEETIATYVERHYFVVIYVFVTFTLIATSILAPSHMKLDDDDINVRLISLS